MSVKVDLYDNAYANDGTDLYQQIRLETYGNDLGQKSLVRNESVQIRSGSNSSNGPVPMIAIRVRAHV